MRENCGSSGIGASRRNRGTSAAAAESWLLVEVHSSFTLYLRILFAYVSCVFFAVGIFFSAFSCAIVLCVFPAHFSCAFFTFGMFFRRIFLRILPACFSCAFFCAFFAVRSLTLYCQNSYTISAAAESNYSSSSIEVEEQRQQNAAGEEELRSSVTIEEAAAAAAQTLWQQCIAASGL